MTESRFFSRDISWLSFNERVLNEALNEQLLLGERLKFLSIYSSNLDEFYRVRMPVLMAKKIYALNKKTTRPELLDAASEFDEARNIIHRQQEYYGDILVNKLIPLLAEKKITWLYGKSIPEWLNNTLRQYFFSTIAAFLQVNYLSEKSNFFPQNNKLYFLVSFDNLHEDAAIINIPSDELPRFFSVEKDEQRYIVFIDDIIKQNLQYLFQEKKIEHCFSFKITRDADLFLEDELPETLAEKIEKQVTKRDFGKATRLLYERQIPLRQLQLLCNQFKTAVSNTIEGGRYHNLKDIMALPLPKYLFDVKQPSINLQLIDKTLHGLILEKDIMLHTPYDNYDTVLRFFNEAAIDKQTEEIYITFYRIATNSRIAHALITAAKNGKKVFVFDELKARFDEENNLRWAKKMKAAGVKVIYSIPRLKVHAKIALVKKRGTKHVALLATGNMNETTAKVYTDHQLFTAHKPIIHELEMLFHFLDKRKKPGINDALSFEHLLVAQFNLQQKFLALIQQEIDNAVNGLPASICIKLNNIEEQTLINKLYEASNAGVKINLIVRSICCLIPGVKGMSENITVKRIVGKYLEHGRVFIFHNNGDIKVFAGSADWMNRNIYTRIEVCFPVYDEAIKQELIDIINIEWSDNVQAVYINEYLNNVPVAGNENEKPVNSQQAIYDYLKEKTGV
ncbi:polyphosphate kinase 1 [Parafilimonas terrae]|uniref:Polyphosphate kinase n=1 Tax=Parafilimonas terrae TaxID=1465490 RepID=A0A1I5Z147_9BACT|nr:polyphosphate kinase 1 [Parafilimonas terrae]SFQ50162.1 polyphosphate kinase [Parafilimonas terrae]